MASFAGSVDYSTSSSNSAIFTIAQASAEVVLVPHPVLSKQRLVSVNLTAEIEPLAPGGGVPTGTVAFELMTKKGKSIQTLGTVSLTGGKGTLPVKASSVLNKSITIVYSGDPNFRGKTAVSQVLTQKGL